MAAVTITDRRGGTEMAGRLVNAPGSSRRRYAEGGEPCRALWPLWTQA